MMHVWSNGAFAIAGVALAVSGLWVSALGLVFLAMASWAGHAWGRWNLDWAGMYVALFGVGLQNTGGDLVPFVLSSALIVYCTERYSIQDVRLVGLLFATSVLTCYAAGGAWLFGLATAALAFFIRQLAPGMKDPHYDLAHSAWHVLMAVSLFALSHATHSL